MNITDKAINFIKSNIKHNMHVYIFVTYPFTKYAHVNINFCKLEDIDPTDIEIYNKEFKIVIDKKSKKSLFNSMIDVLDNQLCINAPNIYEEKTKSKLDLKNKIKFLFENEINVMLSQHGGFIELVDLIDTGSTVVIRFHGGCQGCGMIGYTLNNYIEKVIKKNFPTINKITDVTAHEVKTNAYY